MGNEKDKNDKFNWEMCGKVDDFLKSAKNAADAISEFGENARGLSEAFSAMNDAKVYGDTIDSLRDMCARVLPFLDAFGDALRKVEAIRVVKTPTSWTVFRGVKKVLGDVVTVAGTAAKLYSQFSQIGKSTSPQEPPKE